MNMNMIFKKSAMVAAGLLLCQVVLAANEDKYKIVLASSEVVTYQEPENLLNNSGEVPVSFTLSVPKRAIKSGEARVYNPILVNGGWSCELPSIIVKGRTYDIVNGEECMFKEDRADDCDYYASYVKPINDGVEVTYQASVPFDPSMRGAQLQVDCYELSIARGSKSKGSSSYDKVNNGVKDYTNLYTYDQPTYIYSSEEVVDNYDTASIFKVGSTVVESDEFAAPLSKFGERIKSLKCMGAEIESIDVSVTASFEGSLELNSRLAEGREASIKEVIDAEFPCLVDLIKYSHEDENWKGFIEAISSRSYATDLMSIINSESDLDRREQKLLSTKYRSEILDICKTLRNCSVQVRYKAPKSVEKVGSYELPESSDRAFAVSTNVNVPDNIYDQNRMMLEYMNAGKYPEAFEIYKHMDSSVPSISNNIGVLLTLFGDYPMAEYYFLQADGVEARDYNLGTMYLCAGRYEQAADTFADMKCPNAVIANLAAKRYDVAAQLACGGEYDSALMLYLRAVAYTYNESKDMVLFTLDKACELDPIYKEYAEQYQAEFIPFRDLAAFKKIVK